MNEELKKELEKFAEELKTGIVSPETFEKKMKSFEERINALPSADDVKELREAVKKQGEVMTLLQKGGKTNGDSLAEQIKALVENPDTISDVKSQKKVEVELKLKDASTMFTTNAKPAIDVWNVEVDRTIHSLPKEANAIFPRLLKGMASAPNITWVNQVDGEGGAAWIDEGTLKPLMDWEYETESASVKKIAVSTKVSTEMLTDAPFMRSEIQRLLTENLMDKVNSSVLLGTGVGSEILGVATNAAGYVSTALDGKVDMPNYGDAVRAAVLQMRLLNFEPDTLFINPADKAIIDLTKDTTGHYLAEEIRKLVPNISIVETTNIPEGKFLLIDTSKWIVRVYESLGLSYGWENDDFRKNLVTVIAEMRLFSYQNSVDTGAVIYDNFSTVQAAIEKTTASDTTGD